MITFGKYQDRIDRFTMDADKTLDDGLSKWKIRLVAMDFPSQWARSDNRDVELSVVDLENVDPSTPNVMYFPLEVTAITTIGDETRYHYRQRFTTDESRSISPSLNVEGVVTIKGDDTREPIKNPYLRAEFTVSQDSNNRQAQSQGLGLNDEERYRRPADLQHVDRNENSNGGLDLQRGEQKSNIQENQREQQASTIPA